MRKPAKICPERKRIQPADDEREKFWREFIKNPSISAKISVLNLHVNIALSMEKIFIEDLNLKAMQRLWGKKISDLAFGEFVRILKYQAEKFGVEVVEVDRYFASSQICSQCGEKKFQD